MENKSTQGSTQELKFAFGDKVIKTGGDYTFKGTVTSVFPKLRSKQIRYTVENDEGIVMIFNGRQLSYLIEPVEPS